MDATGESVNYHLGQNLDSFDKCDFDTIANEVDLDVGNIANSGIVSRMLGLMAKHSEYFQ